MAQNHSSWLFTCLCHLFLLILPSEMHTNSKKLVVLPFLAKTYLLYTVSTHIQLQPYFYIHLLPSFTTLPRSHVFPCDGPFLNGSLLCTSCSCGTGTELAALRDAVSCTHSFDSHTLPPYYFHFIQLFPCEAL